MRFNVDEEFASSVDRQAIKKILSVAADVKVEGTVLAIQRQRCAGISTISSVSERFNKWCEFSGTPSDGLDDRLAALQTMPPEEIARQFFESLTHPSTAPSTDAPCAPQQARQRDPEVDVDV